MLLVALAVASFFTDRALTGLGPPLERLAQRVYIAGRLANTPQNIVKWIRDLRAVDSQTVTPAVGVDEAGARDIAAYLYTR